MALKGIVDNLEVSDNIISQMIPRYEGSNQVKLVTVV